MNFDDYLENDNQKEEEKKKKEKSKKRGTIIKIVLIVILIAVLLFLIFWLLKTKKKDNSKEPVLTLNETEIVLNVGESHQVNFDFDNAGNNDSILNWISSDEKVFIINENGTVVALSKGNGQISISYNYKEQTYQKEVNVTVNDNNNSSSGLNDKDKSEEKKTDNTKPDFNYNVSINANEWSKSDVTINLNIPSGNYSAKYSINCNGDKCSNQIVSNKKIVINTEGKNTVYVTVTNNDNGLSTTKEIKVNIDKTKPTCSLKLEEGYIIATPSDTGSDIKYIGPDSSYSGTSLEKETASEGTKTYYVMDNAGNQNTCSIDIEKQTQYRSKSCTTCNTCGSRTYTAWTTTNTSCVPYSTAKASEYTKELNRVKCDEDNTCSNGTVYRCKWQERKVASSPKTSCEECGCSTWGEFGEWQNDTIQASSSVTVETQEVFIQK